MSSPLESASLAGAGQRSWLPALIGVVLALLLWAGGGDLRDRLAALQQPLKTATQMAARGSADGVAALKAAALEAHAQRAAWESRLQSNESVQMTRARQVFDLRQKCAAANVRSCAVRLSDEVAVAALPATAAPVAPAPRGASAAAAEPTLDSLGIVKARSTVSGIFQGDEMLALYRSLVSDASAHWRINGVVVRGNTFELDVERHLWPGVAAGVRPP